MRVRTVLVSVALIAVILLAAKVFQSPESPTQASMTRSMTPARSAGAPRDTERSTSTVSTAPLERQVRQLAARLAAETAKREQLERHVEALASQLAALHEESTPNDDAEAAAAVAAPAPAVAAEPSQAASGSSAMERALVAAGVDATTAAEIKRRHDELTMEEIYLRDQATREEWANSPRFNDELAAINAQRTSIRDDIGDDAYDRFLYAQGHPNRVRVDDVLADSVAAQAGLQTGDIVLRYGDARIFGPEELVDATRSGRAGETTRVEIIRNGARLELQVPRGPLGLRIAGTQAEPSS